MPSPAPRPESHRALLGIAVATAAGLLLGLSLVVPRSAVTRDSGRVLLYGDVLPAGSEGVDIAVERVERRLAGWFNLGLHDGRQRRIRYEELGITLDRPRLRQMVRDVRAHRSAPRHAGASGDGVELVVPVHVDRERALAALLSIKEELDQPAFDARLDLDLGAVIPERAGRLLDVDRSLAAIEGALERGADGAPLAFMPRLPRLLARELADVRHDVLLGFFETRYDTSARARDRAFNLELAASKLDGYVLMPGATFDFNAVVGPRNEANGYRIAPVVAAGELVDGDDSSTCQVSGTLHAAALFAGLDIVERHAHARPSAAIELGFDAAVAYPTLTLRLKNPYDFPVVLRETLAGGRVRAEIRGPRRPHTITIVRRIDAATPYAALESPDDSLERGRRVVAQRGVPGLELHRYRIRRDGAHTVRQRFVDHYPSTPQLIHVGTGNANSITNDASTNAFASITAGRPPRDTMRELLSDELLVIAQSDDPEGPLLERRVPGRFGVPGWSRDVGAPAWNLPRQVPEKSLTSSSAGDFFGQLER